MRVGCRLSVLQLTANFLSPAELLVCTNIVNLAHGAFIMLWSLTFKCELLNA